jgi:hypothetical protein
MRHPLAATLVAVTFALSGCVHHHNHHGDTGGPPPWAPAHGHRAKHHHHHGVDMTWDVDLGVYVVVGFPHIYFHDGHYLRFAGGHWERCSDFRKGGWKSVKVAKVPGGLAKKHAAKGGKAAGGKGKSKGKQGGPAKHWD